MQFEHFKMWKDGFLFVFALAFEGVVGQENDCIFSCAGSNTVNYTGVLFPCGEDKNGNPLVCNPDCKAAKFCVLGNETCTYKCSDDNTVKFEDIEIFYKCPIGQKCNQKYTSCDEACVAEECKSAEKYTCISDTSFKINIIGIIGNCPAGQICNRAPVAPTCDICIDGESTNAPTVTEPPATTTEPPITTTQLSTITTQPPTTTTELPTITTQPPITTTKPPTTTTQAPTTETEPPTTATQSPITTSKVPTTTTTMPPCTTSGLTTPTTTVAPITPFSVPDCNNPPGKLMPCRVGPTGHYYKCKKIMNSSSYYAQLMPCHLWNNDPICGRYRLC